MPKRAKPKPQCPPRCALMRIARELNPDPKHAFQVRKNAERLFHALTPLHGLNATDWKLLEAAALLHDIGQTRGYAAHHKHSRDMVMERDWPSLDPREQAIVATVARYHRKAHPKPGHKVFRSLNPDDQALTSRLAALLRIADGLDRSHSASVCRIEASIASGEVRLFVGQRRESLVDLAGAQKKSGLFVEVFAVAIELCSRALV